VTMLDSSSFMPSIGAGAQSPDASSRSLVANVLQSMSNHIAGGDASTFIDTAALASPMTVTPTDEPDAPGTVDENDNTPTPAPPRWPTVQSSSRYAWGGYENGKIPAKALKPIGQGSHRLETTAADAWIAMREAAAKDGIDLSVSDSYRSYDQQVAVRKNKGHLVATARPGTSVHGWGRAVDVKVSDPKALRWLQANAGRFGWMNPAWAQAKGKNHEPWHWEFAGGGQ
jgi:LAS superfamily LD-carboxypeptidase LdcB